MKLARVEVMIEWVISEQVSECTCADKDDCKIGSNGRIKCQDRRHVLTLTRPGGGGTGREVTLLTTSLCSLEYHHSRNLRPNRLRGIIMLTILFKTLQEKTIVK